MVEIELNFIINIQWFIEKERPQFNYRRDFNKETNLRNKNLNYYICIFNKLDLMTISIFM